MKRYFIRIFFLLLFTGVFVDVSADNPDRPEIIRAWQLIDFYTVKQDVQMDTMINAFHVHNPVFRQSISSSYLGNAGLASFPNIYHDRGEHISDFFFIDHFRNYLSDPSETRYYNTRRPFSLIDFSTGGPRDKNEKILNILHTQNVNPGFNLGFSYLNINSDGQYSSQGAVTNAISLFSSLDLENYQLHASLNLNSVRAFENGGLEDDASLYNENFETEDHAVRLRDARNGLTNINIFLSQSWQPFLFAGNDTLPETAGSWFQRVRFFHVLRFDQYIRTYNDDNPQSGFYDEVLINNNRTFDSLHYMNLTNMLMFQLPEIKWGIIGFEAKAGLKNELLKGSHNIPGDTIFHFSGSDPDSYLFAEPDDMTIIDRAQNSSGSNAIIAVATGSAGDIFGISGQGSFFFHGRRQGEYDLQAGMSLDLFQGKNRSVIEAVIRQREVTPSIFLESFSSNHFSWKNDFRRTAESSLSGSITMPGRSFESGAVFYLLNNYIYFDSTANPVQHNEVIPVINISLNKDFRVWKFYFRNMIRYQVSGRQEVLPLPDISIYNSTWFEQALIRDILNMQIGFDIYFTSLCRGYAWQPATSQFYIQNERLLGNYPYVDVFINFKHKRTRVFLKAEHVNAGQLEPEYFTVLHYPRNHRMFKFGLSWSFYN